MAVYFSLGSITAGALAIFLPMIGILMKKRSVWISLSSLSICAVSIIIQLFHVAADAFYGDAESIYDTIHVRCMVSLLLLALVVAMNVIYQCIKRDASR